MTCLGDCQITSGSCSPQVALTKMSDPSAMSNTLGKRPDEEELKL